MLFPNIELMNQITVEHTITMGLMQGHFTCRYSHKFIVDCVLNCIYCVDLLYHYWYAQILHGPTVRTTIEVAWHFIIIKFSVVVESISCPSSYMHNILLPYHAQSTTQIGSGGLAAKIFRGYT